MPLLIRKYLVWFVVVLPGLSAAVTGTTAPSLENAAAGAPSQVGITVTLSLAAMEKAVERAAVAAMPIKPVTRSVRKTAGVGVDVVATPRLADLRLTAAAKGALTASVPIDIRVTPVRPGVTSAAVTVQGCGATTFNVRLTFEPVISSQGALSFKAGTASADNARYTCRIMTNVLGDAVGAVSDPLGTLGDLFAGRGVKRKADVDVAAEIRSTLVHLGSGYMQDRIGQINGFVPGERALSRLLSRPVTFGNVVTLGLQRPRLVMQRIAARGDAYQLIGAVEGYPRLTFGNSQTAAAQGAPNPSTEAADGFELPAVAVFPRDRSWLPAPAAWGKSYFRLRPVPNRKNLVAVQYRNGSSTDNLIWLSGSDVVPPADSITFGEPMRDVLGELLDWLNKPKAFEASAEVDRLKQRIQEMVQVIARFEQQTMLSPDDTGESGELSELNFSDISIDMKQVWVTPEAIWAEIALRGKAELKVDFAL